MNAPRLSDRFVAIAFIVIGVYACLNLPPHRSKRIAPRAQCLNQLHNLAIAIQNYASTDEWRLPSPVSSPQKLSWRVLLLPLMDHNAMFRAYRLDKPWNDPANEEFSKTKMSEFLCAGNPAPRDAQGRYYSAFALLTGPGTAFDQDEPRTLEELPNGSSQTILVVEACGANIVWNEPRDIDVTRDRVFVSPKRDVLHTDGSWPCRHHAGEINIAYADGSCRSLSLQADPEVLRALTTSNADDKPPVVP